MMEREQAKENEVELLYSLLTEGKARELYRLYNIVTRSKPSSEPWKDLIDRRAI